MNVNPNDYNREERKNSSWWSSRHRSGYGSAESLRQGRRLTLIDLVLLVVMIGVLVPWIVQRDNTKDLGPFRVRIEKRSRNSQVTLILKVSLPSGADSIVDETVGWRIIDQAGMLLHEEYDLPPMPGKSREFFYTAPAVPVLRVNILAGGDSLEIDTGTD